MAHLSTKSFISKNCHVLWWLLIFILWDETYPNFLNLNLSCGAEPLKFNGKSFLLCPIFFPFYILWLFLNKYMPKPDQYLYEKTSVCYGKDENSDFKFLLLISTWWVISFWPILSTLVIVLLTEMYNLNIIILKYS